MRNIVSSIPTLALSGLRLLSKDPHSKGEHLIITNANLKTKTPNEDTLQ